MSELMNDLDAIYRFIKRIVMGILYVLGILLILTILMFIGSLISSSEGSDQNRADDRAQVAAPKPDGKPEG